MNSEVDVHAYVQDLEKHLQLTLFGGRVADPEGAVLLVRGALAEGDSERAENLADATRRLAATTPDHPDMAAAADHARGLVDQDAALLERQQVRAGTVQRHEPVGVSRRARDQPGGVFDRAAHQVVAKSLGISKHVAGSTGMSLWMKPPKPPVWRVGRRTR